MKRLVIGCLCLVLLGCFLRPRRVAKPAAPPPAEEVVEGIPAHIKALGSRDEAERNKAEAELVKLGAGAVPALTEALKDSVPRVRFQAAEALGKIGQSSEPAVGALADALKDEHPVVRQSAAVALGRIGPKAKPALPALVESLAAAEPHHQTLKIALARAVIRIDPTAKEAVPVLIEALSDSSADVRCQAADSLKELKAYAHPAVPALAKVMADPERSVRWSAAEALTAIGPAAGAAVLALKEALHDADDDVRYRSAEALGAIGAESIKAEDELIAGMKDRVKDVRLVCVSALGRVGTAVSTPSSRLVDAIGGVAKDKRQDGELRLAAVAALADIGPRAKSQAKILTDLLLESEPSLQYEAAKALVSVTGSPAQAVTRLTAFLNNPDPHVRRISAVTLGKLGPDARPALPALRNRSKDPVPAVRDAADLAIRQITGQKAAAAK